MSEVNKYQEYPFCEISSDEFYTYARVEDLIKICQQHKNKPLKCRTIGILSSLNGKFYLKDMDLPLYKSDLLIRLSMVYVKQPCKITIMSQPVQIFGTLQWKNEPMIYVKILQVLNIPMAIKLNDAINSIAVDHLAKHVVEDKEL